MSVLLVTLVAVAFMLVTKLLLHISQHWIYMNILLRYVCAVI